MQLEEARGGRAGARAGAGRVAGGRGRLRPVRRARRGALRGGRRRGLRRPLALLPNQVVDGLRAPILGCWCRSHSRRRSPRCHPNARLTPHGRALLAERIRAGWTITAAARAAGVSRQTGSKWWRRARLGELARSAERGPPPGPGPPARARRPAVRAAAGAPGRAPHPRLGGRTRTLHGLRHPAPARASARLDRLEPRPPVVRYERERPGELVHLDTKMLGRIRTGGGLPKDRRSAGYGGGRAPHRLEPGSRRDRRPQSPGLCRGAGRRVAGDDGRLPPSRLALLRWPRDHGSSGS